MVKKRITTYTYKVELQGLFSGEKITTDLVYYEAKTALFLRKEVNKQGFKLVSVEGSTSTKRYCMTEEHFKFYADTAE